MRYKLFAVIVLCVLPFVWLYSVPPIVKWASAYQHWDLTRQITVSMGTQILTYCAVGVSLYLATIVRQSRLTVLLTICMFAVFVLTVCLFLTTPWVWRRASLITGCLYSAVYGGIIVQLIVRRIASRKENRRL